MLKEIPRIGLGTRKLTGEKCKEAVKNAIDIGYRHIDTAQIYGNEKEIGEALKEIGIARDKIRITSKVWIDNYDFKRCLDSVQSSLQDLHTDYLDLVLLHRPCREKNYNHHEALDALMQLKNEGKIRYFGVSNFTKDMLEEAITYTKGQIFAQQIEYHVNLGQDTLQSFGEKNNIILEAYSPLAHGNLGKNKILGSIAEKHKKTIAQVALRRLLDQQNIVILPKASSRNHLEENFNVDGRQLDEDDHKKIKEMPKNFRYCDIPHLRPNRD